MTLRRTNQGAGRISSQASSKSSALGGIGQICESKTRASARSGSGTCSLTPPVATVNIERFPIREPSTNVGIPSASSRSRRASACVSSPMLATVIQLTGGPISSSPNGFKLGASGSSSTSCFGQVAPAGRRQVVSHTGQ